MSRPAAFDVEFSIDAERVRAWAELSGDHNRLHVDPAFAATPPYGRCIAHGPILACMVGEMLATHLGPLWLSTRTEFRFVAPVFVPSTVVAHVEITAGTNGSATVACADDTGTTVLSVRATWTDEAP